MILTNVRARWFGRGRYHGRIHACVSLSSRPDRTRLRTSRNETGIHLLKYAFPTRLSDLLDRAEGTTGRGVVKLRRLLPENLHNMCGGIGIVVASRACEEPSRSNQPCVSVIATFWHRAILRVQVLTMTKSFDT